MSTQRGPSSPWAVLALVSTVVFMTALDNLVVTTALPSIRSDLSVSLETLVWVLNGYTLSFAAMILLGAALGDRYGRRRVFMWGIAAFTAASVVAALSTGIGGLVAARAAQGVGAAMILPVGLTLVGEAFPDRNRGLAFGIWSGVNGLGVAVGPLVGGAVVEASSWPFVFWLNLPVGIVAFLACLWTLPPKSGTARHLDVPGVTLVTVGLAGALLALAAVPDAGWGSSRVLVPLAAGGAALIAFGAWERRAHEPVLPRRFFTIPAFTSINVVNVAMYFGTFGSIFLLVPFLQTVQGHTPVSAGLRLLPWTLMPMFVSPLAGIACDRYGPRRPVAAGLVLLAAAFAGFAYVVPDDPSFAMLLAPSILGGAGMGLIFPASAITVLGAVGPDEEGRASGALNALREVGGALGVAGLATVFLLSGGGMTPDAYADGLAPALVVAAAVIAACIPATRRLPAAGPQERTERAIR
jgi:EmrB/QacA subfamily drug resistance transporter